MLLMSTVEPLKINIIDLSKAHVKHIPKINMKSLGSEISIITLVSRLGTLLFHYVFSQLWSISEVSDCSLKFVVHCLTEHAEHISTANFRWMYHVESGMDSNNFKEVHVLMYDVIEI